MGEEEGEEGEVLDRWREGDVAMARERGVREGRTEGVGEHRCGLVEGVERCGLGAEEIESWSSRRKVREGREGAATG